MKGGIVMTAYQRISRYRPVLMGIAALLVVYQHFFYYHNDMSAYFLLNPTVWYAVGGVDIFVALSGFGIWQSLDKDPNPLRFMGRRLGRLLPAYLPFILIFCVFSILTGSMDKWQALGNLTTFGWWARMGGQFNWFVPSLLVMYLLSPLFYHIIKTHGKRALWVIPFLWLVCAGCVGAELMMGVSRFPVYFLGMYLGKEASEGKKPGKVHLWLSGILGVLSMTGLYVIARVAPHSLSRYGLWWHPYLLSTPGCLYLTSWCLEKQEKWAPTRLLNRGLGALGRRSFEIYLLHLLVFTAALTFGLPNQRIRGWLLWGLMGVLGIALGCVYGVIIEKLTVRRKH